MFFSQTQISAVIMFVSYVYLHEQLTASGFYTGSVFKG